MSLATLAEIGIKAIRLQEMVDHRKVVGKAFGDACFEWKQANGFSYIPKHSSEWDQMLEGISREHAAIRRAKADETNARARLSRACIKAQKEMAAGLATNEILNRAMETSK